MKSEDEILTDFIHKHFIEEALYDNYMRKLIADTFDFKLYLFKYRIIEAAKTLLTRRKIDE